MMKNYDQHPIKFIIVLYLTLFVVGYCSEQVRAASCESGQVVTQYYTTSDTWSSYSIGTQQQTTAFRRLYTNANMNNANVDYTYRAILFAPGRQTQAPTYTIEGRVGTSANYTNIAPFCNMIYVEDYNRNDSLILETYWTVTVKCSIPSAQSIYTRFRLILSQPNLIKMTNVIECSQIDHTPSDVENGVSTIQEDMYNYYSSLWEKSNISEEIILNRIQEAEEGIIGALTEEDTLDTSDQFDYDSSSAESAEEEEEDIRDSLRNPYQDGNGSIANFMGYPDDANTNTFVWNLMSEILWNSNLWILTVGVLTLGIIKLVLSR